MVRLSPPSSTHARTTLLPPTHIRRANVNWYQNKNTALVLTSPPKTFMRLVREFFENEKLATFRGAELEDGTVVTNIDDINFEPIAGVPADFPKLEREINGIAADLSEVKEAVLRVGKVVEALAQHDPTTAMTTDEVAAAAGDVEPAPDVQDGQFGSPVKVE